MKKLNRAIMGVLLVSAFAVLAARPAMAQDPAKVAGDTYKVLLENDRVRVLEAKLKPGDKTAMHSHPTNIVYSFSDAKAKFTPAGGKGIVRPLKGGAVLWNPPETHVSENVGKTEARVLLFELKKLGRHGTSVRGADPVAADPAHFKVLLNNASVRVLEFRAKPGTKVPMHTHPAYVTYNFAGGKSTFTLSDGKTVERDAAADSVTWSESEAHAAQVGDTEAHSLLVEFKAHRGKSKGK